MIEVGHTSVADPAVFGPERTKATTGVAESLEELATFVPLGEERDLLDGAVVVVGVGLDVARVLSVGGEPTHPHNDVPVDETVVRTSEDVPSYWYTLKIKNNMSELRNS